MKEIAGERGLADAEEASLSKLLASGRQCLGELGIKDEKGDLGLKALQLHLAFDELGLEDKANLWLYNSLAPEKLADNYVREQRLELLWRVAIYRMLTDRAGEDAGKFMANEVKETIAKTSLEAGLNRSIQNMGILSLVFRTQDRYDNWVFAWSARLVPWLYSEGPVTYLTVLLVTALVIAVCRALCSFAAFYFAAQAVIGAITRLRRAVYHHTYRLGTLAFRALGPSEAVSVSTRHLESVHDGLFIWLTIWIPRAGKVHLDLAFCLVGQLLASAGVLVVRGSGMDHRWSAGDVVSRTVGPLSIARPSNSP